MPTMMQTMMQTFKTLLEHDDTSAGRRVAVGTQLLILLSLVTFSLDTLPNLDPAARVWLHWVEMVTISVFTVEYLLRVWVADHKLRFIFSFYGLVDLLAILPFFLMLHVDLRSLRLVRLFRLIRVLKVVRYNRALVRFSRAITLAREEIILFLGVTLGLLYFAAVGIYYFEHQAQPEEFASIFHSLWWAVATLTTVGYGDVYPITVGGRIFTFFILLIGLGIVAVPAGLLASALAKSRDMEE